MEKRLRSSTESQTAIVPLRCDPTILGALSSCRRLARRRCPDRRRQLGVQCRLRIKRQKQVEEGGSVREEVADECLDTTKPCVRRRNCHFVRSQSSRMGSEAGLLLCARMAGPPREEGRRCGNGELPGRGTAFSPVVRSRQRTPGHEERETSPGTKESTTSRPPRPGSAWPTALGAPREQAVQRAIGETETIQQAE